MSKLEADEVNIFDIDRKDDITDQVSTTIGPTRANSPGLDQVITRYGCGAVQFTGTDDALLSDYFNRNEPNIFAPLRGALPTNGDYYMHLADFNSYLHSDQLLFDLYSDSAGWSRKATLTWLAPEGSQVIEQLLNMKPTSGMQRRGPFPDNQV